MATLNLGALTRRLSLEALVRAQFAEAFNRPSAFVVTAPGRVNFIGEHTDYNEGFVLPLAIDRQIAAAVALNDRRLVRVRTALSNDPLTIDLGAPLRPGDPFWSNYIRGVVAGFIEAGHAVPGFDLFLASDLPTGAGLSSSAALEVVTATALETLIGEKLDPAEKALLCQRAEHEFAGVPCGIMDQFASVFGRPRHLLLLDCRTRAIRWVRWPESVALIVVNSGVSHQLAGSEYAIRRQQCEAAARALGIPALRDATTAQLADPRLDSQLARRTRHVVTEIARTLECAAALESGDCARAGRLMYESHASLRDDFEVSCPEVDRLVEIARSIGPQRGVHGARMTGGGFGGSVIVMVEEIQAQAVCDEIVTEYGRATGIAGQGFVTEPSAGAGIG